MLDFKEQEKLIIQAAPSKLIHLAEQVIFPLLENRIKEQQYQLINQFKEGKDCTASTAMLASLLMLRDDLLLLARKGDIASAKLHKPHM